MDRGLIASKPAPAGRLLPRDTAVDRRTQLRAHRQHGGTRLATGDSRSERWRGSAWAADAETGASQRGRTLTGERRPSAFQAGERQQCAGLGVEQPVRGLRPDCLLMAGTVSSRPSPIAVLCRDRRDRRVRQRLPSASSANEQSRPLAVIPSARRSTRQRPVPKYSRQPSASVARSSLFFKAVAHGLVSSAAPETGRTWLATQTVEENSLECSLWFLTIHSAARSTTPLWQ